MPEKLGRKKMNPKSVANLQPVKKGEVRNPNGRGKGRRDARTVIWEAMQKIAETQNMTAEEIETLLQQTGLKHALKGNHQFYSTITDRLYGKQKEKETNITITQEVPKEVTELTKKLNDIYRA